MGGMGNFRSRWGGILDPPSHPIRERPLIIQTDYYHHYIEKLPYCKQKLVPAKSEP